MRLARDPLGEPLKPQFTLGFEYSDCWVDDARLVVLNARAAAELGATIATRMRCVEWAREKGVWTLTLRDERTGEVRKICARTVVNAGGPWAGEVMETVLQTPAPAAVRLVKGSHIVTPRLYAHDRCYIFQNSDGRVFFSIPFEGEFTLIGTTDEDYFGDPDDATASDAEIAYLCAAASDYFKTPVTADLVKWSYSGVRPLYRRRRLRGSSRHARLRP